MEVIALRVLFYVTPLLVELVQVSGSHGLIPPFHFIILSQFFVNSCIARVSIMLPLCTSIVLNCLSMLPLLRYGFLCAGDPK